MGNRQFTEFHAVISRNDRYTVYSKLTFINLNQSDKYYGRIVLLGSIKFPRKKIFLSRKLNVFHVRICFKLRKSLKRGLM